MSLRGLIQQNVSSAMTSLGDLMVDVTYTPPGTGEYDPVTGTVSEGTSVTAPALVSGYADRELQGTQIEANDRKFLFDASSLSVRIFIDGKITHDGVDYQIVNVRTDPAEATVVAQGRR